jgi:hypothetical protein
MTQAAENLDSLFDDMFRDPRCGSRDATRPDLHRVKRDSGKEPGEERHNFP